MENVKEYYNHFIPKMLRVGGIVLFGRVFYGLKESRVYDKLRKHEYKHVEQQREIGYIKFKILYLKEFIENFVISRDWNTAYKSISFEVEARKVEWGEDND